MEFKYQHQKTRTMIKKFTLLMTLALILFYSASQAQLINESFTTNTASQSNNERSITASSNHLNIKCKVIYNAIPDGYRITFTSSFIGKNVEEIEINSAEKLKRIAKELKKVTEEEDIVSDIISLDPIYDFPAEEASNNKPSSYKLTQNLSIKIGSIKDFETVASVCLKEGIFDIIDVVPFIESTDLIRDSLSEKSIDILNHKKDLASEMGFVRSGGKPSFTKNIKVCYPSERYLKSYVKSKSIYRHHFSENFELRYDRKVDVDNYYNLDLKNADFIFHANTTEPVIQFMYDINYNYNIPLPEEKEEKPEKEFIFIDKSGKMKKLPW